MNAPDDLLYAKTHEWVRIEDDIAVVGITDFAQDQLSDLTFVELPVVGDEVVAVDEVAVVESVKAASDIYAPLSGVVIEINADLDATPESVNRDPYGAGWLFKIKLSQSEESEELMEAEEYRSTVRDS